MSKPMRSSALVVPLESADHEMTAHFFRSCSLVPHFCSNLSFNSLVQNLRSKLSFMQPRSPLSFKPLVQLSRSKYSFKALVYHSSRLYGAAFMLKLSLGRR